MGFQMLNDPQTSQKDAGFHQTVFQLRQEYEVCLLHYCEQAFSAKRIKNYLKN